MNIQQILQTYKRMEEKKDNFNSPLLETLEYLDTIDQHPSHYPVHVFRFRVDKRHLNSFGGLHGGCISTLVDLVSTFPIIAHDQHQRGGVSIDLNVSFVSGTKLGEWVRIESQVLKIGKTLAFTDTQLLDDKTGRIIARGRHTKALRIVKKKEKKSTAKEENPNDILLAKSKL